METPTLFPLPPLVHCQIAVVIRLTPWSQLRISGHVKAHVNGSALLRRRAASGLDVGRHHNDAVDGAAVGRRTSVHIIFE